MTTAWGCFPASAAAAPIAVRRPPPAPRPAVSARAAERVFPASGRIEAQLGIDGGVHAAAVDAGGSGVGADDARAVDAHRNGQVERLVRQEMQGAARLDAVRIG